LSLSRIRGVRETAAKEECSTFSTIHLDNALYTFKGQTGPGPDFIGPRFIKNLPLDARPALLDFYNQCYGSVMWTWLVLLNIIVLLGKDLGGERPIALANVVVKLCLRMLRPGSRAWCKKWAGHLDHAVANPPALRSAVLQAFMVESAEALGTDWALVLFAPQKLYDTIHSTTLLADGLGLELPTKTLAMTVLSYMAPKTARSGASCSTMLQPSSSIPAGCRDANNMARIALYKVLGRMHNMHPTCAVSGFVDDLELYSEGREPPNHRGYCAGNRHSGKVHYQFEVHLFT